MFEHFSSSTSLKLNYWPNWVLFWRLWGQNVLPKSFLLLAEFSSLWFQDWVLIYLLAMSQGMLPAPRGYPSISHATWPLPSSSQKWYVESFLCFKSLTFSSAAGESSLSKASCDRSADFRVCLYIFWQKVNQEDEASPWYVCSACTSAGLL